MKSKSSAAFIVLAALGGAPAAQAANLCMSAPLASFDGYGAMSPDGHYFVAGEHLMSLPDLRELGRVPTGGIRTFSADNRHLLVLRSNNNGGPGSLEVVDLAAPGTPPHHLDFTTTEYPEVSGNGTLLMVHPGERDVPDSRALFGKDMYYSTQILRVADGRAIAQLDRGYEAFEWAMDASERHVVLLSYNIATKGGEVNLIDIATGQMRKLTSQGDGKVGLSPDGTIAVASDIDASRTTFWDVSSGNSLASIAGDGWLAATPDSNWFFIDDIAVKRGNWSTPYRVPGFGEGTQPLLPLNGRVYAATTKDGMITALDGGSLQPVFHGPSLGNHFWQTPKMSPGNEYVAWSSDANDAEDDKTMGSSNLAVLDGRSGALICHRTVAQPVQFTVLGVTATRAVVQETVKYEHPVVKLYAIENEAAARARLQRENAQAKAQSAKLAPAKRAEAQAVFKQGFDLFQAGEFATAARLFENGLAVDPGNAVASYYLGETYARLGDKDRAAVYYQRAADIAPSTKEGALAVTRLAD
jgi:hypothetical protein